MTIAIAFGNLSIVPPDSLIRDIDQSEWSSQTLVAESRRRRELQWSRGLMAQLMKAFLPSSQSSFPFHSITHDRYLTAVAITSSATIGIDLESVRSAESASRIADFWFPDKEASEVDNASNPVRFLQSWVLKESWAKCNQISIIEACNLVGIENGRVYFPSRKKSKSGTFLWSVMGLARSGELIESREKSKPVFPEEVVKTYVVGLCCSEDEIAESKVESFVYTSDDKLSQFWPKWNVLEI